MVMDSSEGFTFINVPYTPNWTIKVVDSLNNTTDVKRRVRYAECVDASLRVGIGTFLVKLSNTNNVYKGMWQKGDTVYFYADFADASTPLFKGRIDSVVEDKTRRGNLLTLSGRHISYLLAETWITKSYENQRVDEISKNLVDTFLQGKGYTYTNVITFDADSLINIGKKTPITFIDFMRSLMIQGTADGYVDNDLDFHIFKENSVLNQLDQIVEPFNFRRMTGFGTDGIKERDTLTVYSSAGGLPLISTAGSGDRQHAPVADFAVNSMNEADTLSTGLLAEATNVPNQGNILCKALPTIKPGENLWVSIPGNEITEIYKALLIKHRFGPEAKARWSTEVTLERLTGTSGEQISELSRRNYEVSGIDNPNNMTGSYNFTFDDQSNISTLTNLEVSEGQLIVTSGQTSGVMTSVIKVAAEDVEFAELRVIGENLDTSTFEVSVDGGNNYQTIEKKALTEITAGTGNDIIIRVNLDGATAKLDALALLYKRG